MDDTRWRFCLYYSPHYLVGHYLARHYLAGYYLVGSDIISSSCASLMPIKPLKNYYYLLDYVNY